jgi:hypothetical protein
MAAPHGAFNNKFFCDSHQDDCDGTRQQHAQKWQGNDKTGQAQAKRNRAPL